MDAEFKSVNQIVASVMEEGKLKEYWTENEPITEIRCWFDPNEAFENVYENNAIRVIDDKMLIVTFPKKSFLQIPEPTENQLGYLCISTTQRNSLFNRPFHPRHIETCDNVELVTAILEKRVVAQKIEKSIDKTKII